MFKKLIVPSLCFASTLVYAACVDYSDPTKATAEAGAPLPTPSATATTATDEAGAPMPPSQDAGAGTTCGMKSYRGGTAGAVVCPGVETCECPSSDVCCLTKLDSQSGSCTSLAACRSLALQCDGPEDCDGGVCCLEDRTGGGASCKSAGTCDTGKWLCRSDADCANAPPGPRCAPIDLGAQGVDDVGLDGIVGVCGK
jgi:hypothetical protein